MTMSESSLAELTRDQLRLKLNTQEEAVFTTFVSGHSDTIVEALACLPQNTERCGYYLQGIAGSGKTHCLQAVCAEANAAGQVAIYLPLSLRDELEPRALEGLENASLVCIDDIHHLMGHILWEQSLLRLLQQQKHCPFHLVVSSRVPIVDLSVATPGLVDELAWLQDMLLHPLDAVALEQALRIRLQHRGLCVNDEVLVYWVRRVNADTVQAFQVLDVVDEITLGSRRGITISLIREILAALR